MELQEQSRITVNPAVRSGQPIIRGSRTAVADILSLLASGASRTEILDDFPWLTADDIAAALEYAAGEMRARAGH